MDLHRGVGTFYLSIFLTALRFCAFAIEIRTFKWVSFLRGPDLYCPKNPTCATVFYRILAATQAQRQSHTGKTAKTR